jgi:cell filamentation protein
MEQMTELMDELSNENCLADLRDKKQFSERLAYYLSEINAIHPFREGNGRVQREFIRELAWHDGWLLDFSNVTQDEMIDASVESFNKNYSKMTLIIFENITERKRK